MGFAKYFEDNLEIAIERLPYRYETAEKTAANHFNQKPKPSDTIVRINPPIRAENPICETVSAYQDKKLLCVHCGRFFVFSVSDQQKYSRFHWCQPKRCRRCREIHRYEKCMYATFS